MTINFADNGAIDFSKNVADIIITDVQETVYVTFEFAATSSEDAASFGAEYTPCGNQVVIRLADILKSAAFHAVSLNELLSASSAVDPVSLTVKVRTASSEEQSVTVKFIDGGSPEPSRFRIQSDWLTHRPQIGKTYKNGREVLSCYVPDYDGYVRFDIICVGYFANYGEIETLLASSSYTNFGRIFNVDVSYSKVISAFEADGYTDDDVLAYDIVFRQVRNDGSLRRFHPIRYIVANSNSDVNCFMFRNRLGGFDTVYATGKTKMIVEPEPQVFVCRDEESELHNDNVESYSIDSGYIDSRRLLDQWTDFLASTERYEINADYGFRRIIIEEAESENILRELASVSFRYHYAEKPKGRSHYNSALTPFDYEED